MTKLVTMYANFSLITPELSGTSFHDKSTPFLKKKKKLSTPVMLQVKPNEGSVCVQNCLFCYFPTKWRLFDRILELSRIPVAAEVNTKLTFSNLIYTNFY